MMLCRKCQGEGKLNYNPVQDRQGIRPCYRCLGSGIEPDVAYEDYIDLQREIAFLREENERYGKALKDIATQHLEEEMIEYDPEDADFRGAYDCIVRVARVALYSEQGGE